jgi:putative effector of murein hydrolase
MGERVKVFGIEGRSVTETEQRARRLVIAYAILLHEQSYLCAPKWWQVTAYAITGCTVAFFSFGLFGVMLMLLGH